MRQGQPCLTEPGIESGKDASSTLNNTHSPTPGTLHTAQQTMPNTLPIPTPTPTQHTQVLTIGIVLITRRRALPTRMALHADGPEESKDQHGKLGTHGLLSLLSVWWCRRERGVIRTNCRASKCAVALLVMLMHGGSYVAQKRGAEGGAQASGAGLNTRNPKAFVHTQVVRLLGRTTPVSAATTHDASLWTSKLA